MAKLDSTFDASTVPDREEFTPLPPGVYTAMIVAGEEKLTKKGGKMIVLQLTVMEGEYAGRNLYENLNIKNDNPKAEEIAFRTLGEIVKAVGKTTIKDTDELHNKRLYVQVAVDPPSPYTDKEGKLQEGKAQNRIKRFSPISGAAGSVSSPAKTASVGSAAPSKGVEPGDSALPPWKRAKS